MCKCVRETVSTDASSSLRSDSKAAQKPLWLALDEIQVCVPKSSQSTCVPKVPYIYVHMNITTSHRHIRVYIYTHDMLYRIL